MKVSLRALLAVSIALGAIVSAVAVPPSSDVAGQVKDAAGNPIVGATLTFTNTTDALITYSVTTDKKGRFSYTGLLYVQPGMWKMTVKADGFAPSKIHVDSKTSSAVVANLDSPLRVDGTPYEFPLKAFGIARLDITMIPADQVPASAKAPPAGAEAPAAVAQDDPLAKAAERMRAGDTEGALPFYEEAIAAKPADAALHFEYSRVLAKLERVPQAEGEAKKAAELDPKLAGPHRVLANLYAARGDNARAYSEMQKEREISPDDTAVLAGVAQLAELNGKTADAIAVNEAIVAKHPENANAWLSLGDLYARDGKAAQSEAAFRRVTEIDPANAYQTFFNIGVVLTNKPDVSQAEMRKAIEAFKKSVELKPSYGPANKQLAYSLLNVGEVDQARGAIEAYLKVDAGSADAKELASLLSGLPPKKN